MGIFLRSLGGYIAAMQGKEPKVQADRADDRQVLEVTGTDRRNFLHGLVTNDVQAEGLSYAALLSPQGKYLADFFLLTAGDTILIDVKADFAAPLMQRLNMYRLRADVAIAAKDLPVYRGTGAAPEGALPDPRHPSLGWRHYGALEGVEPGQIDWNALRVAAAVPEAGIELIPNDSYILEMGFERLNGVDFKKGCYVGQEVTARMKHKTELKKGLVQVALESAVPVGTEILSGAKTVGAVYTQSGGRALAYLNFGRATGALTAGGISLETVTREQAV